MNEEWVIKKPEYGDHIRVDRGIYRHHGIYAADDEVYAFQAPLGVEVSSENAVVLVESLADFLKGGTLEVRLFSEEEKTRKRSPLEIVNHARSELGNKGYNLFSNNCEHFANRCVFGESHSSQVDQGKDLLNKLFGGFF